MDKYEVKLLSKALRDLDGIYAYIAKKEVVVVTVRYSKSSF